MRVNNTFRILDNRIDDRRRDHLRGCTLALMAATAFICLNAAQLFAAPGDLDPGFGSGGKVVTAISAASSVQQVVMQLDGKIVVAGYSTPNFTQGNLVLARYASDGTLDSTFGTTNGYTLFPTGSTYNFVDTMVMRPDGKFLLLGRDNLSQIIVRFSSDGLLDTSFGSGSGFVRASSFSSSELVLAADGKFYLAGNSVGPGASFCVARYNEDGTLDTNYGTGGISATPPETNYSMPATTYQIALQADGRLIFGSTIDSITMPQRQGDIMLFRLDTGGSLDTTFGTNGFVYDDLAFTRESLIDLAIQADGKIVVAGHTDFGQTPGRSVFLTQRYLPNGAMDTAFREPNQPTIPGSVLQDFPGDSDSVSKLTIDASGKIVIAGSSANTFGSGQPRDFSLTRILPTGALDAGFGESSRLQTDIEMNSSDIARSVAIQADGKIVAVGETTACFGCSAAKIAITRYMGDSAPASRTRFDFDGDGKADRSVFRPSTGAWYLDQSKAGFFGALFGEATDRIAPADYDGDGRTDIAVYRPSLGLWYILNSSDGTVSYPVFGSAEDLPTPGDYDGDGKADVGVYRPSTSTFYRINSSDGSFSGVQFGQVGDRPTIDDYDGDGKSDIGIYRPSDSTWYQLNSSNGTFFGELFGATGDRIAPADYDGDGKTDIAVYRPSESLWVIRRSSTATYDFVVFGIAEDRPAVGDYDGDGKADLAVFRPSTGYWYALNSSNGAFTSVQWGASGDIPTPNAFGN